MGEWPNERGVFERRIARWAGRCMLGHWGTHAREAGRAGAGQRFSYSGARMSALQRLQYLNHTLTVTVTYIRGACQRASHRAQAQIHEEI